jgi:preprotein translocase subunit SecD
LAAGQAQASQAKTSMFSAVFFSRGLVNLWYGRQKKLQTVSIGTVWRPDSGKAVTTRD